MTKINTLAFIVTDQNYSLALATMPPGFALLPTNKVFGDIIVLNDVFTPKAKHFGRVAAYCNARYSQEDFYSTYACEGDITDEGIHVVHRI